MGVKIPVVHHSIRNVRKGITFDWLLEDKRLEAKRNYNDAAGRLHEWKRFFPHQHVNQSAFARRCVHEMIGAFTRWLIYKGEEIEGDLHLTRLYEILNETPPRFPPQSPARYAGLFTLLKIIV
ncbi:hypothetical protein A2419_02965 [Candidatus Adlerbacteria bacterium RIFOXYC1_FULL_48_26]|uniref:Uncharacterized protein n=1 Tax=Candidatus Adlerbacteria bacterium RIFOXYC1_FULL_48_26 TaxID=1797247 RepID=A0A1F4Y3X1_9BACT|nr:MAG: hypothetical protein A2419_02965 [Candidatus Adlerbacteria bacterium RIFOXYC1_FULL_48_26]OGC93570.1 MAG: hypothetical protein A2389_00805 [Candidatus Adlerbacteria bacterium RIFOXYB1_FULL_48_10]